MFFLNNMYARRFEQNMERHRLDAKIAPPKPKPACRPMFNEGEQKHELVTRFAATQGMKEQAPVAIRQTPPSPPPTYQEFFEPKSLVSTDSQLSLFEKPAFVDGVKPIKRSNSQESGFCSNTGEDVVSQFSVQA